MRKHVPSFVAAQPLVFATLIFGSLSASAQSYWKPASGLWSDAANWSSGIPTASVSAQFGIFTDSAAGLQTAIVDADGTFAINQLNVGYGKAAEIQMQSGSSLSAATQVVIGAGYGTTPVTSGVASALTVSAADAANKSTLTLGGFIAVGGHNNAGDNNALTFTGPGLIVNHTGNETRMGAAKSGNIMTVSNGAQYNTGFLVNVSRVDGLIAGAGNNNRLVVDGAGSSVNINASGQALNVASYASVSVSSNNILSGNRVDVTNGGLLRAATTNATNASVRLAANRRTQSNVIEVSGTGSRLEAGANGAGLGIQIGWVTGHNDNRGNGITVSSGGLIKNEGSLELYNTSAVNQNYLRVSAGGTYAGTGDIDNRGGVIHLEEGGALVGQLADGSASKTITINLLNFTGSPSVLYAEGSGLGSSVNVNAQSGSIVSVGNAANSGATALELNSAIDMSAGSTLQFLMFADGSHGSIDFGATGSLNGAASLSIMFVGHTPSFGDQWVLFSGNTAGIASDFALSTSTLPTLADGLNWDTSRLNADGGWVLGVVPEPGTSALAIGGAVLAVAMLARRRLSKSK